MHFYGIKIYHQANGYNITMQIIFLSATADKLKANSRDFMDNSSETNLPAYFSSRNSFDPNLLYSSTKTSAVEPNITIEGKKFAQPSFMTMKLLTTILLLKKHSHREENRIPVVHLESNYRS